MTGQEGGILGERIGTGEVDATYSLLTEILD